MECSLYRFSGHCEWYGFAGVCPCFDWCEVVGHDEDSVAVVCFQCVVDGSYDVLVDEFDCLFLYDCVSAVACFVGCFNVYEHDVVFFEGFDRGFCFSLVVCVDVACCSWYFDEVEPDEFCESLYEVDGSDCGAFEAVSSGESFHDGSLALSPEPDGTDGILSEVHSDLVYVVAGEEFL